MLFEITNSIFFQLKFKSPILVENEIGKNDTRKSNLLDYKIKNVMSNCFGAIEIEKNIINSCNSLI